MIEDQEWTQDGPRLGNQFLEDSALREYLSFFMGNSLSVYQEQLTKFGNRVVSDILEQHFLCEKFPPVFESHDAWGRPKNKIYTHPAWSFMHKVSAEEGLISIGYSSIPHHRLLQFAKLYLFGPSSGLYSCPLAMTDGAAFLTKQLIAQTNDPDLISTFSKLTSTDPSEFWTSGQWMTEKRGGSDVRGSTRTYAIHVSGDKYKLYGYKWFTSATTADIAYTLARVNEELSLFLVNLQENQDTIKVVRLKEKLGTRQLPTAEMVLQGCMAKKVSDSGIRSISSLINITRLYNSVMAVSNMRRIIALSREYSSKRIAFGKKICEHPLHQVSLAEMEVEFRGCLIFLLFTVSLLEKVENNEANEWEDKVLRIITPILKLYTGKKAMKVVSEGIESIGGVAYMENSGIPGILRDCQVLTIWEGTTNVLSLDVIRAINKLKEFELLSIKNALHYMGAEYLYPRVNKVVALLKDDAMHRVVAFEIGSLLIEGLLFWQDKNSHVYKEWQRINPPQVFSAVRLSIIKKIALDLTSPASDGKKYYY